MAWEFTKEGIIVSEFFFPYRDYLDAALYLQDKKCEVRLACPPHSQARAGLGIEPRLGHHYHSTMNYSQV